MKLNIFTSYCYTKTPNRSHTYISRSRLITNLMQSQSWATSWLKTYKSALRSTSPSSSEHRSDEASWSVACGVTKLAWASNTAWLMTSVLKATFLLAVLAMTIEMHFAHHLIVDLTLDCFTTPSENASLLRICSAIKRLMDLWIWPVCERVAAIWWFCVTVASKKYIICTQIIIYFQ